MGERAAGVPLLRGGRPVSCLGLYLDQLYETGGLPFSVDLKSEGIIGPSAGLAFTLGLLEKLDPSDLTGGHLVAATGTMSITGQVGDVGGVAQKTVAVRERGAVLFLVPPQEYAVAKAHAGVAPARGRGLDDRPGHRGAAPHWWPHCGPGDTMRT